MGQTPMAKDEEVNGPKIVAEIISKMDSATQTRIVANIEAEAPEIAVQIHENMFCFDEIAELPDRSIQILAQAVNHHDLVLSLRKANPHTKERIYENISERKLHLLQEDSTVLSPVKSSDVDTAQKRILKTLDDLRANGKIRTASDQDLWA